MFLKIFFIKAYQREPRQEFPDLEKEFEPNLLNSTVYIISMFLQVMRFGTLFCLHTFLRQFIAVCYDISLIIANVCLIFDIDPFLV